MLSDEVLLKLEHPAWGEGKLVRIEGTDWIVLFESFGRTLRFPVEARSQLKVIRANHVSSQENRSSPPQVGAAWRPENEFAVDGLENDPQPLLAIPDEPATSLSHFPALRAGDIEYLLENESPEEESRDTFAPPESAQNQTILGPITASEGVTSERGMDQRGARRAIESLSVGLPPISKFARKLAINFQQTERLIQNVLNDVDQDGGAAVIIKGEYGQGKTFALRCLEEMSVESGFLVARTEVDATENRLNRPHCIYRDLIRHLRVPGEADLGVDALIRRVMPAINTRLLGASHSERLEWLEERLDCRPLAWLFSDESLSQKRLLVGLLAADPAVRTVQARFTHWSQIEPRAWPVFNSGTQGDFACFLLSGLGRLARLIGLKGLIVIMDEMEKWQDLHWREQTRAGNFLGGLIWGATTDGRRHRRPKYSGGLEHSRVCGGYPFTTKERNHVGIAIAMTPRSEEENPETIWCQYGGPILDVDLPRLNSAKLIAYCERVAPVFAEAFSTAQPSPLALNAIGQDAIAIWKAHGEMTMRSAVQSAIAAFHNWRDRCEHQRSD